MDIYDELGVRKIINGSATLTMLGGSIMPPEVLDAMRDASQHFVNIDELQDKAGRCIAELTRNEAAYVSSGAAAAMVLSTAACIAGKDETLRARLPYSDGMRNEVIVHRKGRVGYDYAIRQAGGKLIEVGDENGASAAEFEAAFTDKTCAVFVFWNADRMPGQVPLDQQIAICHRHGVPLIVDAAAQIPPVENLWNFTQMGADLAIFSGGKGLRGPQSSGLILGRHDLVEACAFHACPRPFIGRGMKAGKEEIVGLLAAVRLYLNLDHSALMQQYEAQTQAVITAFAGVPGVTARRSFPNEAGQPMPRAEVILDEAAVGISRNELLSQLLAGEPAISLSAAGASGVYVNPQTLEPGQEHIVCARIKDILGISA